MIALGTVFSQLGKQPCQGEESLGADHFSYFGQFLRDTLEPIDESDFFSEAFGCLVMGRQQQDSVEESGIDKSSDHGLASRCAQAVDAQRGFQCLPKQFNLPSNFVQPLNGFAVNFFYGEVCDHEIPLGLGFFEFSERSSFFFGEIIQAVFPFMSRQPQGDDPVKDFTITNFQKIFPVVSFMGFQAFPDVEWIPKPVVEFGNGQRDARDKESSLLMQAIQILGIKVAKIANDQVSRLRFKDMVIPCGVIRTRGFGQFEIRQLSLVQVVEGVDFNSSSSSTASGTWELFFQLIVQADRRRVCNQDVFNARYFDVVTWQPLHFRKGHINQRTKHMVGFFHFFADSLRADFLPNGLSDLKSDIGISQGIGFKETNGGCEDQWGQFSLSFESAGGSGDLIDGFRGKKSSGISVASARSYLWPPCLASLGSGFVLRHHWRPSSLNCPVKSVYYKRHPLRSAPYATLGDCYVVKGLAA